MSDMKRPTRPEWIYGFITQTQSARLKVYPKSAMDTYLTELAAFDDDPREGQS